MNKEDHNICREGVIRAIDGDSLQVEIIVSSACSGCHAKSICIPSDRRQEIITVKNTLCRKQGGGAGLRAAAPRVDSVAFRLLRAYTQRVAERRNRRFRGHRLLPDSEIGWKKGGSGNCVRNTEKNSFRQFLIRLPAIKQRIPKGFTKHRIGNPPNVVFRDSKIAHTFIGEILGTTVELTRGKCVGPVLHL